MKNLTFFAKSNFVQFEFVNKFLISTYLLSVIETLNLFIIYYWNFATYHLQEIVFASNDGKETSLTFYSSNGTRLRRVTLPKPDLTPLALTFTKRGHLFICSHTEVLCLDSDYSDLASIVDLEVSGLIFLLFKFY